MTSSLHINGKDVSTSQDNVFDDRISSIPDKYTGTHADIHDMSVMGKKQVLRVILRRP